MLLLPPWRFSFPKCRCSLQRFYEWIKKKRGSGKAIIATARKFLGIIYRTLKHNWVFADFPNFALAKS